MAIEGIGNSYGIPVVKKEKEPVLNERKKQQKKQKGKKKRDETTGDTEEGKIDIRI